LAADADCSKVHILEAVRREDDEGHRSFNLQLDFGHLGHLGEEKWRKIYKGAKVANVEDGHLSEETKRGDGDPFACLKDSSLKLKPIVDDFRRPLLTLGPSSISRPSSTNEPRGSSEARPSWPKPLQQYGAVPLKPRREMQ